MLKRSLVLLSVVTVFCLSAEAGIATASNCGTLNQASVYVTTNALGIYAIRGVRTTVINPGGYEHQLSRGDNFVTSVMAQDNIGDMIQQGVTSAYDIESATKYGRSMSNPCGGPLDTSNPTLIYFMETAQTNMYTCSYEGNAAYGAANLMSVTDPYHDGVWDAWMNGQLQQEDFGAFLNTNGKATLAGSFAEEQCNLSGTWVAKYDNGGTPLQYSDGTSWHILHPGDRGVTVKTDSGWSMSRQFSAGHLWSFTYNK